MRLVVEAVDPSSLIAVRDITALVSADDGYVESSSSAELITSGEIKFGGYETWVSAMIRITALDGDIAMPLGTFFATPQDVARSGSLISGTIHLDGPLLALSTTLLDSTYVAASGATSLTVIRDMCRISGRQDKISESDGNYRFADATFYEAGTSCLRVAQDAATRAGLALGADALGFITATRSSSVSGALARYDLDTTIMGSINKGNSLYQVPSRVIATYQSSGTTLSASASLIADPQDASTRGRHVDKAISVGSMDVPSLGALVAEAQRQLDAEQASVEWAFDTLFQDVQAGTPAIVHDDASSETLIGRIVSVRTTLDAMMSQHLVVRGGIE